MEAINNIGMMYDKNEAVRNLNRVEGFEPKDYLRKEDGENGFSLYLDTKYRLLWFRLVYPKGKIVKIPKSIGKDYATFEARIYADVNDAPEDFLANGFASRYKDETNELFGLNFVETAETAALGRALKDAGFGTQFCDVAMPNDESLVDASINLSFEALENENMNPDNEGIPAETTDNKAKSEPAAEKKETVKEVKTVYAPVKKEPLVLNAKMPFDELMSKMTLEYAKSVKVDFGYDIGKTLGELAQHKPKSIQFHADRSQNNLVKAAAQYLLNAAQNIA